MSMHPLVDRIIIVTPLVDRIIIVTPLVDRIIIVTPLVDRIMKSTKVQTLGTVMRHAFRYAMGVMAL